LTLAHFERNAFSRPADRRRPQGGRKSWAAPFTPTLWRAAWCGNVKNMDGEESCQRPGGFRREVQPRRQHWFLNEKSGFPFRTPAFCSVSRGQRRLGEKEYRAPSVTPGVALRPRTQAGWKRVDLIQTGDRSYCVIGEWEDMAAMAAARPNMIATLNSFRDTLEDLGGGLGVTDAVSGPVVIEIR